jgi:endonuclease-3
MLLRLNVHPTLLGEMSQLEDPFKVLIGTILSSRTKDETAAKAAEALFQRYPGYAELAKAVPSEVERLIRQVGFYRTKAPRIVEVARIIKEKHGGKVPDTLEELDELPAVGRKTANCVLVYAFGKPAIPVDTHVHRISNRLGIANSKNPEDTEGQLEQYFRRSDWIRVNELLIKFGKTICKPIGPRCNICILSSHCKYFREKYKPTK